MLLLPLGFFLAGEEETGQLEMDLFVLTVAALE